MKEITGAPDPKHIATSYVRTPESHDADVHAPLQAADERVLENTRKPRGDCGPILHVLQLRSSASDAPRAQTMEAGISDHVWSIEEIIGLLR
jgi:hypothetical protein